jgi:hypothetical protein
MWVRVERLSSFKGGPAVVVWVERSETQQFTARRGCWVSAALRLASTQPPMRRRLSSSEQQVFRLKSHCSILPEHEEVGSCVARSSRGPVEGWAGTPGDHLLSVPALRRRTPHSAFAMTGACSTAERRPLYGNGADLRRPARVGSGRLHPRDGLRHALFRSARAPHSSLRSHSLVRPAPRAFFRPDRGSLTAPRADRVKAGPLPGPRTAWP